MRSSDLRLRPGELYSRIREPYFFGYVRDELIRHYGASTVRSGGLRVYTTINPRFQRAAEISIRESLDEPGDPASAVVSINPANGALRAMTAVTPGRKYEFNLVAQARRQAGSTFKTFVLATAVMKKHRPVVDVATCRRPITYQPDPNIPAWEVSTYDHSYSGWTTIRSATIRSDNSVFAQLTVDVGPENVAETARRMGVRTPLLAVPSLGLGSIAISPLDLASGYATLAGRGVYSRPMAIRKVILPGDRGEDTSAGWGEPRRRRVMSEEEAYVITKILEENMQYGTGTGAALVRPAAGKTGTTDDHADAWFAGYTPNLTTVVWVGYPQGEIPMENVHGISVSGGSFPAEIWRLFMQRALWESEPLDWVVPAELPDWEYWERGDDVLSYDPYAKPEKTEETTTEEEPEEEPEERASRTASAASSRSRLELDDASVAEPQAMRAIALARLDRSASAIALVAGGTVLLLVAAAVLAHPEASPVSPGPWRRCAGWSWLFLAALSAAAACYALGVLALARTSARVGPVVALAVAIQLVPLAGPALLSTDLYTYWARAGSPPSMARTRTTSPQAGTRAIRLSSAWGRRGEIDPRATGRASRCSPRATPSPPVAHRRERPGSTAAWRLRRWWPSSSWPRHWRSAVHLRLHS